MPIWLVENPTPVYVILTLAFLGLAFGLWVRQEKKFAAGMAVVLALAVLVRLLDCLVVTDYERAVLNVQEMAGSVKKKDVERIFTMVSDRFEVRGVDKKRFRAWVERRIQGADVTELKVWEFERPRT